MTAVATAPTVRERPILFSGAMVRAILDGSKTQTRRVVLPQPPEWIDSFGYSCFTPKGSISGRGYWKGVPGDEGPGEKFYPLKYGKLGDLLWVRETLEQFGDGSWVYAADQCPIELDADDARVPAMVSWAHHQQREVCSSIHMPRWACRLVLELTDVRVEKLQRISHEDALAEGIDRCNSSSMLMARERYQLLWDSLNASRGYSWDRNPWVWVLSFRRADR
jgi:hypothetical protein